MAIPVLPDWAAIAGVIALVAGAGIAGNNRIKDVEVAVEKVETLPEKVDTLEGRVEMVQRSVDTVDGKVDLILCFGEVERGERSLESCAAGD